MAEKLRLEVYTPEGVVLNEEVDEIEGHGFNGAFGVMPSHTPYFVLLKTGILSYRKGEERNGLIIEAGYAVVEENVVKVIVPAVDSFESINYESSLKERDKILEAMKGLSTDSQEFIELDNSFRKTSARIQAYEKFVKKG